MKNPIVVITGPTASGKTALSFELVPKFGGEIICSDSMTVYRGLDIGTDKPTLGKDWTRKSDGSHVISGIRHHLLDILEPNEEFNAALFKKLAQEKAAEIWSRGGVPFLVGGSLLYIDAFVYDFEIPDVEPDPKLRKELSEKSEEELFERLVELDPDAEWTVDRKNKRRLIRALEVCLKTGRPFTAQKKSRPLGKNVLYLTVDRDRLELNRRINRRVDEMMEAGFLDEVRDLYGKYGRSEALQATGYRQLVDFIEKKTNLETAVAETKKSHRRFAKRQKTWLRRNQDKHPVKGAVQAEALVADFLGRRAKN